MTSVCAVDSPSGSIIKLLQADVRDWQLVPSEPSRIEIAPGYGTAIWQDAEGNPLVAMGVRSTDKARIILYSDRAFLDPGNTSGKTRQSILNTIRWAGKKKNPKVGVGASLEEYIDEIEAAGMEARLLKTSELVDQVDVFCLAVRPNGGVFGEGRIALKRFVESGGGLILAGTGNEQQMTYFNSLTSAAGIRFASVASKSNLEKINVFAAGINDSNDPSQKSNSKIQILTTPLVVREKINLPLSAEGPIGAALELINNAGSRKDRNVIGELKEGLNLSGEELAIFQEALIELNRKVGPIIPTREEPVIPGNDQLIDAIMELETELNSSVPVEEVRKIAAADNYPGAVPDDASRIAKTLTLDFNYKGWLPRNNGGGARAAEWRPTGLYAAPGEVIRVTVPSSLADKGLVVRIGAYGGKLSDRWTKLNRYRDITRRFPIESRTTLAANGFGGIVTIQVPMSFKGDKPNFREILIEGAVEAPLFEYGKTDLESWSKIRKHPGAWAELVSERMILTVPSESVRNLRNPDEVMQLWNQVVDSTAELAVLDRSLYRAERIVFDRQLSNPGVALHAGQPVAAHTGRAVETALTPDFMRSPRSWGFLHELGHVHQDKAWSLPGSIEASCNLWSVYVSEELLEVPRAKAHRTTDPLIRRGTINTYFNNGAKFETDWQNNTALESYLQIQEAFGWEVYQKFFASYQDYDSPRRFDDQQEINDLYVERMSEICGVNLSPFYRTWGLKISERTIAKTSKLPDWEADPVRKFRN